MTTRRNLLALAGGVLAAAALPGCRPSDPARATATAVPDVLFADSRQGLVRLSGADSRNLGTSAVLSGAGDVLYHLDLGEAGEPSLVRLDPSSGDAVRSSRLGGGWLPRAISADGRACALGRSAAAERPAARARTPLLIKTESGEQRYDLDGVIEPDAFTADGLGLFVLQWLPAGAPEKYRVRLLDLGDSQLRPLYTRDKVPVPAGAEEEMSGIGRQAVLSADRNTLYTLYTHQPGHQHTRNLIAGTRSGVHAFVHVLKLDEQWAYCLDLPDPFGHGPAAGHALAVYGNRLAVVDLASGHLAYADPETLTIDRVVRVPAAEGEASLVLAPDGRTLIGAGATVTVLGPAGDSVAASWTVPGAVHGLGLSPDAARVYAGTTGEVVWLDAASGALLGRAPVAGLNRLTHVG
ncbi:YncE family protein [Micromonosporaceae bacterium Da 78-11]